MAGCRTAIKKAGDHHRLQTAEKLNAFNGVHLLEIDAEENQTDSFKVKAMGAYACSNALRTMDKNAGSVFEQHKALARLRAHLRDEVRNRPR